MIRVLTYFILALFLYLGRHAAEVQLRQTFVGWLVKTFFATPRLQRRSVCWQLGNTCFGLRVSLQKTRRRVDRLESDLQRQRAGGGAATSVEQLVFLLRKLQDHYQSAAAGVAVDKPEDVALQVAESQALVDQCLSILCAASSLYAVTFTPGDEQQHQDIIRAFLNDRNSSTAEWNDVRVSVASPSSSKPTAPEEGGPPETEGSPSSPSSPPVSPLPPPSCDRSWPDADAPLPSQPHLAPTLRVAHIPLKRDAAATALDALPLQDGAEGQQQRQTLGVGRLASASQQQPPPQDLRSQRQQQQQQQEQQQQQQQQQLLLNGGADADGSVVTASVGEGEGRPFFAGSENPPSPKQRNSGSSPSPPSSPTLGVQTKTGAASTQASQSGGTRRPLEGFKLQQLYVLPFPRSRRGSESDAEGLPEEAAAASPGTFGGGEFAGGSHNKGSLLSDLLPRGRRGSRFTERGPVGAVEEKLLKVAMLFSPQGVREKPSAASEAAGAALRQGP